MKINDWINNIVWGVPVLLLILGTGILYTIRLGFLQFRHPILLLRETVVKAFRKKDSGQPKPGEMTSFQAAMTSVGAIVGSGNIAGIATAIVIGGPARWFGPFSRPSWAWQPNSQRSPWASGTGNSMRTVLSAAVPCTIWPRG